MLTHHEWDQLDDCLAMDCGRVMDLTTGKRRLQELDDYLTTAGTPRRGYSSAGVGSVRT